MDINTAKPNFSDLKSKIKKRIIISKKDFQKIKNFFKKISTNINEIKKSKTKKKSKKIHTKIINLKKYVIAKDKTKIYYHYSAGKNKKPCLIFIHGWTNNFTIWEKSRDYMEKKGYPTLSLDLRGHGKSKAKKISFNLAIDDLNRIIKKEKLTSIILIGHSMGGMISQKYYLKHPKEVKKLILINTSYSYPGKLMPFSNPKVIYYCLRQIYNTLKNDTEKDYFKNSMLTIFSKDNDLIKLFYKTYKLVNNKKNKEFTPKKESEYYDFRQLENMVDLYIFSEGLYKVDFNTVQKYYLEMRKFNTKKELKNIKTPTLIISSKNDAYCNQTTARIMHKQIKKSKMVTLNQSDHISILQENQKINREIEIFLKEKF